MTGLFYLKKPGGEKVMHLHRTYHWAVLLIVYSILIPILKSQTTAAHRADMPLTTIQESKGNIRHGKIGMPQIAPLFIEDPQFTSTLVLVNPSSAPASANVILRALRGKVIGSQVVNVPPSGRLDVSIGMMLQFAGSAETTGSIVVLPASNNIVAALSLTYRRQITPS